MRPRTNWQKARWPLLVAEVQLHPVDQAAQDGPPADHPATDFTTNPGSGRRLYVLRRADGSCPGQGR
jgi:hypothetical protein